MRSLSSVLLVYFINFYTCWPAGFADFPPNKSASNRMKRKKGFYMYKSYQRVS